MLKAGGGEVSGEVGLALTIKGMTETHGTWHPTNCYLSLMLCVANMDGLKCAAVVAN